MAGMARVLWIVGLTIALFVFSAITIGIVYALFTRHHLNVKGWIMLATNGYIVWITFWYLRQKIAEKPSVSH
jgi:hypothetical protein